MHDFDDEEIAREAYRLWHADGSPLWGRPEDHWIRAIELLKSRRDEAAAGEDPGAIDAAASGAD